MNKKLLIFLISLSINTLTAEIKKEDSVTVWIRAFTGDQIGDCVGCGRKDFELKFSVDSTIEDVNKQFCKLVSENGSLRYLKIKSIDKEDKDFEILDNKIKLSQLKISKSERIGNYVCLWITYN